MHIRGILARRCNVCAAVTAGAPNNARPLAERPLKSYGRINEDTFSREEARERERERERERIRVITTWRLGEAAAVSYFGKDALPCRQVQTLPQPRGHETSFLEKPPGLVEHGVSSVPRNTCTLNRVAFCSPIRADVRTKSGEPM